MNPQVDQRKTQIRRESLTKVGQFLMTTRNDLAYLPGAMYDTKIRDAVAISLRILRRFKINQIPKSDLDTALDISPLAKLYYVGQQILSLWELQTKLNQDIRTFNYRISALQASRPAGSDDVRVSVAEAHDFMIFATFANELQVEEKLTAYSLSCAEVRNDSGFAEGTRTLESLKAAYLIQLELEKPPHKVNTTISSPVSLSETTLCVIREWYKNLDTYMDRHEKEKRVMCCYPLIPFDQLLTWFSKAGAWDCIKYMVGADKNLANSRRRILADTETVRPVFKAIVDKAVIARRQFAAIREGQTMDDEQEENRTVGGVISDFASELAEIAALVPLRSFNHPDIPEKRFKSPLYATYWISEQEDPSIKEIQVLLKAIYESFTATARISLEIMLRAHWQDVQTQYRYTSQAKNKFDISYLQGIGVFLGAFRLKEVDYCIQFRVTELAQARRSEASLSKSSETQTKPAIQAAKTGQKRPADTMDDGQVSKVPRLSKDLEGDPFPKRLCEAISNTVNELNNAEEDYCACKTGLSTDDFRD